MQRKNQTWKLVGMVAGILSSALALAQQPCPNGTRVDGVVTDPTGALIPGAQVQTAGGMKTTTDTAGRFVLSCVPVTSETITVQADGFLKILAGALYVPPLFTQKLKADVVLEAPLLSCGLTFLTSDGEEDNFHLWIIITLQTKEKL